jgi:gp16 family phage-associated protein
MLSDRELEPGTSAPSAPTRSPPLRSATEARQWMHAEGLSVAAWAADRGFPAALVYAVISGRRKCLRGQSHRIAQALGMKPPTPTEPLE